MPRFYFHARNGKKFLADCQGVNLPDSNMAHENALRIARDFFHQALGRVDPGWADWWIDVRDERGRAVFTVPLAASATEPVERAPVSNTRQLPVVVSLDLERTKRKFVALKNESRIIKQQTSRLLDYHRYEKNGLRGLTALSRTIKARSRELVATAQQLRLTEWDRMGEPGAGPLSSN
jgi:hypothetical protein